jgi:hypothetical protein
MTRGNHQSGANRGRRKPRALALTKWETKQVKEITGKVRPFRAARYQVETIGGKFWVEGLQLKDNGDLAIRPFPLPGQLEPAWKIDHIPTGFGIPGADELDLKRCVALVVALGKLDWSGNDQKRIFNLGPQVFAAMDELKIDYGKGIKIEEGDVVEIDLGKMKPGDSVKFRL